MTPTKSDLEKNREEVSEKKHSKLNILSFGGGVFLAEFFGAALGGFSFFYYETEIGLSVWLVSLAFSIYSIYNAINDPLIGYIVDRPYRFWRKWGRRFPWIISASIPWFFMTVLMFSPPFIDPKESAWLIFFWLLIIICLYDTFYTFFSVSYYAIIPEKFRLDSERRTAQGYIGALGFIGMLVGFIIPSLIVSYGNKASYATMAWIAFVIGIVVFLCIIPGVREDTKKIDSYIQSEKNVAKTSFISILKLALKQKNFVIYIFVHFMNQVLMACLGASIHYAVRYVLGETADVALIVYAGYFLGAFLGVPVWVKVGQKLKNNKKLLIILGLLLVLSQVPLLFLKQLGVIGTAILIIPYGFSFSGFWTTLTITVSADVVDDVIVNIKMRKESLLAGIRAFFLRLAIVAQSVIFAVVHTLTNFTEGAPTQPLSAQWGILVHLSLIPLICILVAILIFWKWYDITPEKREKILIQLKELNL